MSAIRAFHYFRKKTSMHKTSFSGSDRSMNQVWHFMSCLSINNSSGSRVWTQDNFYSANYVNRRLASAFKWAIWYGSRTPAVFSGQLESALVSFLLSRRKKTFYVHRPPVIESDHRARTFLWLTDYFCSNVVLLLPWMSDTGQLTCSMLPIHLTKLSKKDMNQVI